jgi:hypothetical protein
MCTALFLGMVGDNEERTSPGGGPSEIFFYYCLTFKLQNLQKKSLTNT